MGLLSRCWTTAMTTSIPPHEYYLCQICSVCPVDQAAISASALASASASANLPAPSSPPLSSCIGRGRLILSTLSLTPSTIPTNPSACPPNRPTHQTTPSCLPPASLPAQHAPVPSGLYPSIQTSSLYLATLASYPRHYRRRAPGYTTRHCPSPVCADTRLGRRVG